MTEAERLLWRHLRDRQMADCKFRRQHPVGPFVVDFICIEEGIIIELDGGQHAFSIDADVRRSKYLESRGYEVMRFWNNDVMQRTDAVLNVIHQALERPSPRPSPQRGEGE
jgi:primosomal protein N' (replication factor Y)